MLHQKKNTKQIYQKKKLCFVATAAVATLTSGFSMLTIFYSRLFCFFSLLFYYVLFFRVHTSNLFSTGDAGVKPAKKYVSEKHTTQGKGKGKKR